MKKFALEKRQAFLFLWQPTNKVHRQLTKSSKDLRLSQASQQYVPRLPACLHVQGHLWRQEIENFHSSSGK